MVNYKCLRCGFETSHKNNFRKHIFRKFVCKPILNEVDINFIREKYKSLESENAKKRNPKCNPFVIPASSQCNPLVKKYKCKYCNKEFTKRQNKWRHETKVCKKQNKDLENRLIYLENEISNLKKENVKITNNIQNKINSDNQIIINNFGNENLSYLTENKFKKILMMGGKSIPSLIKQIHFNPKHPENHNVRIKNKKLKFAEVRHDNKWKYKHKKAVLDDLVDFGYITLEEFKENNEEKMDDLLTKGFNRMMNKYEMSKDEIIEDIEMEVLNGMNEIDL